MIRQCADVPICECYEGRRGNRYSSLANWHIGTFAHLLNLLPPCLLMKKIVLTLACCVFILFTVITSAVAQKRSIDLDKIITEMKLNKKGRFPYGFKPGTPREKVKQVMPAHADKIGGDSTSIS